MATGDLEGNLERLRVQLRTIGYPHSMDMNGLKEGNTASILPLLHYALLGYSRHVSRYLSENGYALFAKSDLRFVECALKYLREEFAYRCPLTVAQIFSRGFAERKILLVCDVIQVCKKKHSELVKQARQAQQARKVIRRAAPSCDVVKNVDATNVDSLHMDETLSMALEKVLHAPKQAFGRSTIDYKGESEATKANNLDSERPLDANNLEQSVNENGKINHDEQVHMSSKPTQPKSFESSLEKNMETQRHKAADIIVDVDPSLSHCYDKLRAQIVEVADKMEKLILTLKEDVQRITSDMQVKLTSLERQTQYLEQTIPSKDLLKRTTPSNYSSLQLPYHADLINPQLLKLPTSINSLQGFQCNQEQISTRELIASIKARCNKTKELLMDNE